MGRIVLDHAKLKSIVDRKKSQGRIVVFGNGCFEIIHVGHIRYLKAAKKLGDVLIVAINDDESMKALKKRDLIVTPAIERAEIVASIKYVDYVTLFSERSVENLLRLLKPDIHAKGTDYTQETVPEREVVLSYGGRVAIVGDEKTHSTSEIIERIKAGSPTCRNLE
ncbi:MAG: adenylyltransferase/cytidyltransferase family protein [Desulfobacterota bacterium]|nr:adenylyltransferase/cytidyltransferase family protein [Thermodesulfobacteriota bacterium]MDW8001147.1 adenylyltransferase/cytidyltransferase family protein [Deltaproteobacteria bacterium]